jgi:hypothetical protein
MLKALQDKTEYKGKNPKQVLIYTSHASSSDAYIV